MHRKILAVSNELQTFIFFFFYGRAAELVTWTMFVQGDGDATGRPRFRCKVYAMYVCTTWASVPR